MVRIGYVVLAASLLVGCSPGNKEEKRFTEDAPFVSTNYQLGNYTARVFAFLREREETRPFSTYQAIFVNTKDCSACIRGAFSQIEPFLSKTDVQTFVYANDSSLVKLIPANDAIEFVCLAKKKFQAANIFHTELYMYSVKNDGITSTYLNIKQADSLNAL